MAKKVPKKRTVVPPKRQPTPKKRQTRKPSRKPSKPIKKVAPKRPKPRARQPSRAPSSRTAGAARANAFRKTFAKGLEQWAKKVEKLAPKKRKKHLAPWEKALRRGLTPNQAKLQRRYDEVLQAQYDATILMNDLDNERAAIQEESRAAEAEEFELVQDYRRRDGRHAKNPCFLRHVPDALKLRRRLIAANGGEDPNKLKDYWKRFRQSEELLAAATLIAEDKGATLREVYTLFWSP